MGRESRNLARWFPPKESIADQDVRLGMRMLLGDGVCSQAMGVFATGAFLAAYAVLLGASNFVIGIIAAIGPATQVLQIPAVYLVNRSGARRGVVVLFSIFSRAAWFVIAGLPFFAPPAWRIPILLTCLILFFGLGAVSGCAWNSWVRDLIPDKVRGSYFGNRLAVATAVGAVLSIVAGMSVSRLRELYPENGLEVYSGVIALGAIFGLIGVFFLFRTPEPRLETHGSQNLFALLKEPLKNRNYRNLLSFLAVWNFGVNLGAPFFTVYMLQRLEMNISWIILLAVISQFVNVIFFRIWGAVADRFSNRAVLSLSGSLFVFGFLLWPFTTMPEKHGLTLPLLVVIHVLVGISTAGVLLCTGTISAKIAPLGKATSYLACNAFVCGIAATLAPLLGGAAADALSAWDLTLGITVSNIENTATNPWHLPAFQLRGHDFLFIAAFVVGLYSLHRLLSVNEEGELRNRAVVRHLAAEARKSARAISNVAGMRSLTAFPYEVLERGRRFKSRKRDLDTNASQETENNGK